MMLEKFALITPLPKVMGTEDKEASVQRVSVGGVSQLRSKR
jgi:hypothetical protein